MGDNRISMGILIATFLSIWIVQLSKISEAVERRPDVMPATLAAFHMLGISRLLFVSLAMLGILLDCLIPRASVMLYIANEFTSNWILFEGIGLYFACVPKPPAKRKEQERGFGFLTPVPIKH